MTDIYTEIKSKIRGMNGKHTPLLLTGKVESVDGETCTVTVGELKLTDVRLRSVVNGKDSKLLITPEADSYVTLIDLSGELRDLMVIGYSEIKSIDIEGSGDININCNGTITFNGGDNNGLVNIKELTNKLNKLVQKFNGHTHSVSTAGTAVAQEGTAAPVTSQASTFNKSDYEDTKIKH